MRETRIRRQDSNGLLFVIAGCNAFIDAAFLLRSQGMGSGTLWTDVESSGPSKVFFTSVHSTCGPKRTQVDSRIGKQYQMAVSDLKGAFFPIPRNLDRIQHTKPPVVNRNTECFPELGRWSCAREKLRPRLHRRSSSILVDAGGPADPELVSQLHCGFLTFRDSIRCGLQKRRKQLELELI